MPEATSNTRRDTPLYQSIFDNLRQRLGAGEWPVSASFLSEAEISAAYSASRITVRHALRLLESEGYIRKAAARRTTVVATAPQQRRPWVVKSIDDIIAQVADASFQLISWKQETSPEDAELLGLPSLTRLNCLRGVLVRAGAPFLRSIIYFPPEIGAKLREENFNDVVVFRVLARELGLYPDDVRITVWPELAGDDDVALLKCRKGEPLLVTQLFYSADGGKPTEVAYSRRCGPDARFSTSVAALKQKP
ncbi:GntR family transcriptional regulator [Terrarubrum flagellatum]|uniref:GntR family transcriptional regulator n=1 Tax=Terrirubrum flagellatum TaxID=2895980 RepID=UPI0031450CDB